MHKILITGGFGYVGGRITRYLGEAQGAAALRVLTRRGPDRIPGWAKAIEVVRGDLRDAAALATAVAGIHTVIHLAAADEVVSGKDPDEALEVTGRGTYRLLQAARDAGVRREAIRRASKSSRSYACWRRTGFRSCRAAPAPASRAAHSPHLMPCCSCSPGSTVS